MWPTAVIDGIYVFKAFLLLQSSSVPRFYDLSFSIVHRWDSNQSQSSTKLTVARAGLNWTPRNRMIKHSNTNVYKFPWLMRLVYGSNHHARFYEAIYTYHQQWRYELNVYRTKKIRGSNMRPDAEFDGRRWSAVAGVVTTPDLLRP